MILTLCYYLWRVISEFFIYLGKALTKTDANHVSWGVIKLWLGKFSIYYAFVFNLIKTLLTFILLSPFYFGLHFHKRLELCEQYFLQYKVWLSKHSLIKSSQCIWRHSNFEKSTLNLDLLWDEIFSLPYKSCHYLS